MVFLHGDTIDFFLPIDAELTKKSNAENPDDNALVIAGWASTPSWDFQGESVDPVGIDDSYFRDNGFIDYEHDKDVVIGVPTENTFVDSQKGLFVEARLFKDNPYVQTIQELVTNLEAIGSTRKIGFSIEGQIGARDEQNPRIIRSVLITGVAVTKNPANPDSSWSIIQKSIQKSNFDAMTAGYGVSPETQVDGAALRPESLASSITNLAYGIRQVIGKPKEFKDLAGNVAQILDDKNSSNPYVRSVFLQLFGGLSESQARKYLESED
ncbi:HK97 family phage prohead protease [Secundilactobacillus kimchicus]|uniref:HK97 family phage prohead protease n=1 Tax=Secundilactobacillus kimchicus TaxID=528209 RepID=UPI001C015668